MAFGAPSFIATHPDIRMPATHQFSLGVDQQFGSQWALGLDYVGMRGKNEVLRLEANPLDPVTLLRPQEAFGSVPAYASIGHSNYDALQLLLRSRRGRRASVDLAYTLSRSRNDSNYYFDLVQNEERLAAEEGPSLNDQRHRLTIHGLLDLPWDFSTSGIVTLSSAQPFFISSGMDIDGDGVLDRPEGVERNAGRGDGFSRIDLRVSRRFDLERFQVEALAEFFNLFNTTNIDPATIVQNQLSPQFGQGGSTPHPLHISRQIQFGLRVLW